MLVPTMSRTEVTSEVLRDREKIFTTTLARLINEYHRERRKLKICHTAAYTKAYTIRSAAKNNWIIFIEKCPTKSVYKTFMDASYCFVTYYFSKEGLLVLRQLNSQSIEAFYGHLFSRYSERLALNLNQSVDKIKHFFSNNGYINAEIIEKD